VALDDVMNTLAKVHALENHAIRKPNDTFP
jgi:hypothetical protein